MEKYYQEPQLRIYTLGVESMICISGGVAGGDGKPGAEFTPDDIFEGGNF